MDEQEYLEPEFDPSALTVPRLRSILVAHDVNYPSPAKKGQLIDLFNEHVFPQARKIRSASLRVKRSSKAVVDVPASQVLVDDKDEEVTARGYRARTTHERTEEVQEVPPKSTRHMTVPAESALQRASRKHAGTVEKMEPEQEPDAKTDTFLERLFATIADWATIANWMGPYSTPTSSATTASWKATSSASELLKENPPTATNQRYAPISGGEFRLIRIDVLSDVRLYCTLETSKLENAPDYVGLSYAWDRDASDVPIIYNNRSQHISRHLHDAVSSIVQKGEDRLLWIDQICIDQDNKEERSRQVSLMAQIYSKATKTYIWLGQEAAESGRAFELLKHLGSNARDFLSSPEKLDEYLRTKGRAGIKAVVKLLCRRWFSRMWVLQEACLSHKPVILCGEDEMGWADFHMALHVLIATGTLHNALNAWSPRGSPDGSTRFQLISVEDEDEAHHEYAAHFQSYCQTISLGAAASLLHGYAIPDQTLSQIL